MADCVFCKIVRGEIPCAKVYEDEKVLAFDDIHPMAPVHVVLIPKHHIATLLHVDVQSGGLMEALIKAAQEVARKKGVAEKGFRVVINCNAQGGQVVFHLHMHLLGGRQLEDQLG
ncbi:MAG TPA: histidine triad nucleotide-binding protein [Smithella sp.]|nr:histidine triad nucleotide-binding protein [Smithella sp.]